MWLFLVDSGNCRYGCARNQCVSGPRPSLLRWRHQLQSLRRDELPAVPLWVELLAVRFVRTRSSGGKERGWNLQYLDSRKTLITLIISAMMSRVSRRLRLQDLPTQQANPMPMLMVCFQIDLGFWHPIALDGNNPPQIQRPPHTINLPIPRQDVEIDWQSQDRRPQRLFHRLRQRQPDLHSFSRRTPPTCLTVSVSGSTLDNYTRRPLA